MGALSPLPGGVEVHFLRQSLLTPKSGVPPGQEEKECLIVPMWPPLTHSSGRGLITTRGGPKSYLSCRVPMRAPPVGGELPNC